MANPKRGKIPIKAAERVSEQYDCPMVIIFGIERGGAQFCVTTFGEDRSLCSYAATLGEQIAEAILKGRIKPVFRDIIGKPEAPMEYESE